MGHICFLRSRVQGHFRVIWCTFFFKMACNSNTTGRRGKQTEIWESGTLATHILGTFDLVGFNVILGSFSAVVLQWPVTRKWLVVEQPGVKFGTRGHY